MNAGEVARLRLDNPERVERIGYEYGGPLKLYHRTDKDNAVPVEGEHIIVKVPSYTQWASVGHRSANPVEYWLLRVVEVITPESDSFNARPWHRVECIAHLEPGRKRKVVTELVAMCDRLAAEMS